MCIMIILAFFILAQELCFSDKIGRGIWRQGWWEILMNCEKMMAIWKEGTKVRTDSRRFEPRTPASSRITDCWHSEEALQILLQAKPAVNKAFSFLQSPVSGLILSELRTEAASDTTVGGGCRALKNVRPDHNLPCGKLFQWALISTEQSYKYPFRALILCILEIPKS